MVRLAITLCHPPGVFVLLYNRVIFVCTGFRLIIIPRRVGIPQNCVGKIVKSLDLQEDHLTFTVPLIYSYHYGKLHSSSCKYVESRYSVVLFGVVQIDRRRINSFDDIEIRGVQNVAKA